METMKEFKYFSIFNHKKEEEYLRKMHQNGWRFVRVGGFGVYHFERCEGADYVYQLDYNPQTKETRDDYLRIFSDCGWEYIQDYVGYSYFRKSAAAMRGDEAIFSDDESRTAMMGRVYKGRVLPLMGILCGCLIPQFILNLINKSYVPTAIIGTVIALYAAIFTFCAISHHKMKKK
jgi:hypothetical protein